LAAGQAPAYDGAVTEFLLRLAILLVLVGLVVWDIQRERHGPHPTGDRGRQRALGG
jgi:hypothetical protein